MWTFEFEAPKGKQMHRYGVGVSVSDLMWHPIAKKWAPSEEHEPGERYITNRAPVKTFRALKRHLRKYGENIKPHEIIWTNRYVGYDVKAVWKD